MEGIREIARNKIGSINKCQHGVIHIHCKGVSLHFNEDAFFVFASMVKEGASVLMDEYLANLVRDRDTGEEK